MLLPQLPHEVQMALESVVSISSYTYLFGASAGVPACRRAAAGTGKGEELWYGYQYAMRREE